MDVYLGDIVKSYLIRKNEFTNHKFERFLYLAVEGLKDIDMDISGLSTWASLVIDQRTLTAPLPDDYINYKRIGVCINNYFVPMGYNPDLCLDSSFDSCGNDSNRLDVMNEDSQLFFPQNMAFSQFGMATHTRNGETIGRYYGIGGGQRLFGDYVIDTANNRIQFGSILSTEAVIEYLASPAKSKGRYIVSPYIKETLVAWLGWQSIEHVDGISGNEKERKRREYYNQRRLSEERMNAPTLDEINQFVRKGFKSSPKL